MTKGLIDDLTETDAFCLARDFDEWARLCPEMPTGKDGDGEYEDGITRTFYACFEHAYKKGMWGAARKINDNIADQNERLLVAANRVLSEKHSACDCGVAESTFEQLEAACRP